MTKKSRKNPQMGYVARMGGIAEAGKMLVGSDRRA